MDEHTIKEHAKLMTTGPAEKQAPTTEPELDFPETDTPPSPVGTELQIRVMAMDFASRIAHSSVDSLLKGAKDVEEYLRSE